MLMSKLKRNYSVVYLFEPTEENSPDINEMPYFFL